MVNDIHLDPTDYGAGVARGAKFVKRYDSEGAYYIPDATEEQMNTFTIGVERPQNKKYGINEETLAPYISHETMHGVVKKMASGGKHQRTIVSSALDNLTYYEHKIRPKIESSGFPSERGMAAITKALHSGGEH